MIRPIAEPPATIRPMAHDDLPLVSDIERRSYEFPWSHGVFRDCLLAGYHCVVVDRDARVAGYGILSIAAGEAHILNLCVDPNFRAYGYGERMLDQILLHARSADVREIFLEVRPSNQTALALYRKKGFHLVANRPAYYQAQEGREDAAVLAKKLIVDDR
ncbi:MAG: ribosomal protein S18-alanine N-acetyltransferase [Woeseiaceae bacterium]|nr:ribosomal protein S18-alanine N-acetyltransferase [Woeseiaceae bacterium]